MTLRTTVKRIPYLGYFARKVYWFLVKRQPLPEFPGSRNYWEARYLHGGDSGAGSYNELAVFKASILNNFVAQNGIQTVIEFGSGDGNQLALAKYPSYLGFDVSNTAIDRCRMLFADDNCKRFKHIDDYDNESAEMTLSLDVIFHLIEDEIYEQHMTQLFNSAERFVVIYSSNHTDNRGMEGTHVRHHRFTDWISEKKPDWELLKFIPNRYPKTTDGLVSSGADFYFYKRR